MYYELYIDVFFFVNFVMDYLLLLLIRKVCRSSVSCIRIFWGALLGAACTCLIIVLPISSSLVKFILFHGFVNVLMLRIGLKIRNRKSFLQALILLYVCGILLGGVFLFFRQYMRVGSLFGVAAIGSYHAASGIWRLLEAISVHKKYEYDAVLRKGQRNVQVRAIVDTGNLLKDPLTGKPVHLLSSIPARELFGKLPVTEFRYIPYQSIGNEAGTLPIFVIDELILLGDVEKRMETPLVAVCSEERFAEDYQLILNPERG